uniref:ribosomal protein S7 n=1 Tax=Scytothamnus australis TaxID=66621 RepID=UPI002E75E14F|nr:ribosomal protein S7 [Scytothamnus australis]WBP70295.1 ribosomal protein S7 [Scytothamnus australis]
MQKKKNKTEKRDLILLQKESFRYMGFGTDPLFRKMVNLLMRNGKRAKAEKVLYKAFDILDREYPGRALHIFYFGVFEARRDVGIRMKPKPKKRRQANSYNVYVPFSISPSRGLSLGMRALLKASLVSSPSQPLWETLSRELLQASQRKGDVVAERFSLNKLANSNRRRVHLGFRRHFPVINKSEIANL